MQEEAVGIEEPNKVVDLAEVIDEVAQVKAEEPVQEQKIEVKAEETKVDAGPKRDDLKESALKTVNDFVEIVKTLDYTPSMDTLCNMAVANRLTTHKLCALYWAKCNQLAQLTFVFNQVAGAENDEIWCPPRGSYNTDPFDREPVDVE
jgi:hypothetical protein